ncbi:hypothetical protein GF351_01245 [Candidatus Woesearchaeota archaeon]|nr:hypothetical protein [Candidatus Woesearchaeota archaeon]
MRKKAQGLSMNTIIIAALALLVLVIVAVIFMVRLGIFRTEASRCENNGGICKEECSGEYERHMARYWCDNDGDGNPDEGPTVDGICCIST